MPTSGIVVAVTKYHQESRPKGLISTLYLMIVIQCLCSFQLFVMPVFDNLERIYVTKKHKACPRLVRSCIKVLYGGLAYFTAVAFPFLISLAKFIGGIALPLSLVYPCFMWILIKKQFNVLAQHVSGVFGHIDQCCASCWCILVFDC